jgi:hypothetical protein
MQKNSFRPVRPLCGANLVMLSEAKQSQRLASHRSDGTTSYLVFMGMMQVRHCFVK